jgi:LPS export ABC transporter protein LptC
MKIFFSKIFLPVLLCSIFLCSCADKFEPPKTDYKSGEIPNQESWNSKVIFSDSGNIKAILYANHISVYNDRGYTLIDSGATVDFYKNGEKVSKLTGKRGKVIDATKDMEIYDDVKVENIEGNVLTTQRLFWNNKLQKVSSDVFVRIKTRKENIEGIGFESDDNLKNYKIFKVTGTF